MILSSENVYKGVVNSGDAFAYIKSLTIPLGGKVYIAFSNECTNIPTSNSWWAVEVYNIENNFVAIATGTWLPNDQYYVIINPSYASTEYEWKKYVTNADLETSAMQLFDYSSKEFDFNNPNYPAGVYRLGSESRLSNAPKIDIAFSPILVVRENATDTLAMVGFPYSIEGTIVFRQANKTRWSNAPWFKLEGVTI